MKITVQVKPNTKQQKIEITKEGIWIINLKSPPVNGKANQELVSLIAKELKVTKSQVTIKSGLSNKKKVIEITDI